MTENRPIYAEKISGHIAGPLAPGLMAGLHDHALEHEVVCHILPGVEPDQSDDPDSGLELHYAGGMARVLPQAATAPVLLHLTASDAETLHVLQELLAHLMHGFGVAPVWDHVTEGVLAPNVRLVQVVSVRQISPNFRRVRVAGDIARFGLTGLHFRLLLPPLGRAPQWPRIDAAGRTRWASGEDKLHNPAYTTLAIDAAAGWLDFDVFVHDGGRTTAWTETARPGDTVGIIGPGGGWIPKAAWVALLGDETALPSILRILEALPPDRTGVAVVAAAAADLPDLPRPEGVTLHRVDTPDGLIAALETLEVPPTDRYVWFAAGQPMADQARVLLRNKGLAKIEMMAAAFWSADPE